jgi:hypothetical protein
MWYFGTCGDYGKIAPEPKPGKDWLRAYDPDAYRLLDDIYSGRMRSKEISVVQLVAQSPSQEGSLRSLNSDTATTLQFVNKTAEPIKVYWLDFEETAAVRKIPHSADKVRARMSVIHLF